MGWTGGRQSGKGMSRAGCGGEYEPLEGIFGFDTIKIDVPDSLVSLEESAEIVCGLTCSDDV